MENANPLSPWLPPLSGTDFFFMLFICKFQGPPGSSGGQPGPGTPIMPSPQDSSNSGGENMYTLMKPVPSGNMSGVSVNRIQII